MDNSPERDTTAQSFFLAVALLFPPAATSRPGEPTWWVPLLCGLVGYLLGGHRRPDNLFDVQSACACAVALFYYALIFVTKDHLASYIYTLQACCLCVFYVMPPGEANRAR